MYDRSVEFPNRYRMTAVPGTSDKFDLIPAPGEVTNEGTAVNKAALLSDETAGLFGLGADAVVDDALKIASSASIRGAVTLLSVRITRKLEEALYTFDTYEPLSNFDTLFITFGVVGTASINARIYSGVGKEYLLVLIDATLMNASATLFGFYSVAKLSASDYAAGGTMAYFFDQQYRVQPYAGQARVSPSNPSKITVWLGSMNKPENYPTSISILGVRA